MLWRQRPCFGQVKLARTHQLWESLIIKYLHLSPARKSPQKYRLKNRRFLQIGPAVTSKAVFVKPIVPWFLHLRQSSIIASHFPIYVPASRSIKYGNAWRSPERISGGRCIIKCAEPGRHEFHTVSLCTDDCLLQDIFQQNIFQQNIFRQNTFRQNTRHSYLSPVWLEAASPRQVQSIRPHRQRT